MPTITGLKPLTPVKMLPLAGCDNDEGIVIKFCAERCCGNTGEPCKWYVVEYFVKNCTSGSRRISEFCESDLVEILP